MNRIVHQICVFLSFKKGHSVDGLVESGKEGADCIQLNKMPSLEPAFGLSILT